MTTILPDRIQAKIALADPPPGRPVIGPCWVWTGRIQAGGYGEGGGRSFESSGLMHRYTYRWFIGDIAPGLHVDHLCRNRACCNPCHLEAVTPRVNSLRSERAMRTKCGRGHELSGHNLIFKDGQYGLRRECRTCKYASMARSLDRRHGQGLPAGDPRHGITGYQAYLCRCEICCAAGAASWQRNPARLRRQPKPAEHRRIAAQATRGTYTWTGPELELACRRDLTSPEVARMLGRTVAAVQKMRSKLRDDPRKIALAGVA